jgi:hypothetical protein
MAKLGGKGVWIAVSVVLLLALAIVPTVSSAASPSAGTGVAATTVTNPCASAATSSGSGGHSADKQWAYGGQGWSNWTFTYGNVTMSYNSSFGWTVVFTVVSNSTTGITLLEEQRTVGITVWANMTKPNLTVAYYYHAFEMDGAFANITNHSTVYVNGQPVPALGILNASAAACSAIRQTLAVTNQTATRTASLNVTGVAQASVAFTPSLGLIPLNMTGVYSWNSTSTASAAASWNVSFNYTKLDGKSGSGSIAGSLSGTSQVYLFGSRCWVHHLFSDHKARLGVILGIQGPFTAYDGFIFLPRSFDFFGPAAHGYDSFGFGSAGIDSESLYLSPGPGGFAVTAADQSFGAVNPGGEMVAAPQAGLAPEASTSPAATVYGQPMTVGEAKAVDQGLITGAPGPSARSPGHGGASLVTGVGMLGVVAIVAVCVIVGIIGAVTVSYSRRRLARGGVEVPAVPQGATVEDPNRRT